MPIVRKAECLVYLGIASSISAADLARFDLIHGLAESAVRRYLQNDLAYAVHTELLPAGQPDTNDDRPLTDAEFRTGAAVFVNGKAGTSAIVLKHSPVWSAGLRVWEDVAAMAGQAETAFDDDSELTQGSDFWLDVDDLTAGVSRTGILHRFGVWSNEPRSIKVEYYGGAGATKLAENFDAIREAILLTVEAKYLAKKTNQASGGAGPMTSERIGKWGATYGSTASSVISQGQDMDIPVGAMRALQTLRAYRY